MADPVVVKYIKDNLEKGIRKEHIHAALVRAGHRPQDVAEAFQLALPKSVFRHWAYLGACIAIILIIAGVILVLTGQKCHSDITVCADTVSLGKLKPGALDVLFGEKYCLNRVEFDNYMPAYAKGECNVLLDFSPSPERSASFLFSQDIGGDYYLAFRQSDSALRDKVNANLINQHPLK